MLQIEGLKVSFFQQFGFADVIRGVNLTLQEGEWLGLVGESGSGKTMTALSILGLIDAWPGIVSGRILYKGRNLLQGLADNCRVTTLPHGSTGEVTLNSQWKLQLDRQWEGIRGREIGMIFQEPVSSLDPYFTVGEQIEEVLLKWNLVENATEARQVGIEWLNKVAIRNPEKVIDFYPHELSGGMAQRVMIALALCAQPKILIADEPTTALDATIQKQVMLLLNKLRRELNLSIIFISHNMPLVTAFADRIAVMYKGRVIENLGGLHLEKAKSDLAHVHPFTAALLNPLQKPATDGAPAALPIKDFVGCEYAHACQLRQKICFPAPPALQTVAEGHAVACVLLQQRPKEVTTGG